MDAPSHGIRVSNPVGSDRSGMDAASSKAPIAFGFITVLESAEHGLFGGYLVLSSQGRPLEFRCSTPVVANRAQEILYGPTLREYLLTDVVAQALVAAAEVPVEVILTDQPAMLPLALLRGEEVWLVERTAREPQTAESTPPAYSGPVVALHNCRLTLHATSLADEARVAATLEPLAKNICLAEPFDRIRAALAEAQLATHDAAEYPHDRTAAA